MDLSLGAREREREREREEKIYPENGIQKLNFGYLKDAKRLKRGQ